MDILYEDNHIIAAVKPAGVLSQSDGSGAPDMLALLKRYIKEKYDKPGNVYLGLVHRLDRPVGGVMVFARTSKAASRLSSQIREHTVGKYYVAVVTGTIEDSGVLTGYISKDEKDNKVTVYDKKTGDSKYAELSYELLGTARDMSLVRVALHTGRSHQIRAQFAHAGHPLIGDHKYGNGKGTCDIALFCSEMQIDHPVTKERMTFTAALPSDYPWHIF
ncbi:MAG: RluA family pseudouridine synthase [Clostridiales bacterium]|nr:RluA family pseudouridine synthase [Clostridiales bacterium]